MARPKNPDDGRVQTALRLDPDLLTEIKAEADRRCVGRSVLAEHLLRLGLDALAPLDGATR